MAHLGRWKSNAILAYAEEALEQMPANLSMPMTVLDRARVPTTETRTLTEEDLEKLRKEMEELKATIQKKEEDQGEYLSSTKKIRDRCRRKSRLCSGRSFTSTSRGQRPNSVRMELLWQQLRLP